MQSGVEAVTARVEGFLGELGSFSRAGEDTFLAKRGSTVVGIHVIPGEGADVQVLVQAAVVAGADLLSSPELLRSLLEYNHQARYGAFAVDPDGRIWLRHVFLGPALTKEELLPAVIEVAKAADDWDDMIVEEVGGERALDLLHRHDEPQA
jgi:hypothetical protein